MSTKTESSDATPNGYYLDCNSGQAVYYTFTKDLAEGFSAIFWFRPKPIGNSIQTLFALQSTASSQWDLTIEYLSSTNSIQLQQRSTFTVPTSASIITPGKFLCLYTIY